MEAKETSFTEVASPTSSAFHTPLASPTSSPRPSLSQPQQAPAPTKRRWRSAGTTLRRPPPPPTPPTYQPLSSSQAPMDASIETHSPQGHLASMRTRFDQVTHRILPSHRHEELEPRSTTTTFKPLSSTQLELTSPTRAASVPAPQPLASRATLHRSFRPFTESRRRYRLVPKESSSMQPKRSELAMRRALLAEETGEMPQTPPSPSSSSSSSLPSYQAARRSSSSSDLDVELDRALRSTRLIQAVPGQEALETRRAVESDSNRMWARMERRRAAAERGETVRFESDGRENEALVMKQEGEEAAKGGTLQPGLPYLGKRGGVVWEALPRPVRYNPMRYASPPTLTPDSYQPHPIDLPTSRPAVPASLDESLEAMRQEQRAKYQPLEQSSGVMKKKGDNHETFVPIEAAGMGAVIAARGGKVTKMKMPMHTVSPVQMVESPPTPPPMGKRMVRAIMPAPPASPPFPTTPTEEGGQMGVGKEGGEATTTTTTMGSRDLVPSSPPPTLTPPPPASLMPMHTIDATPLPTHHVSLLPPPQPLRITRLFNPLQRQRAPTTPVVAMHPHEAPPPPATMTTRSANKFTPLGRAKREEQTTAPPSYSPVMIKTSSGVIMNGNGSINGMQPMSQRLAGGSAQVNHQGEAELHTLAAAKKETIAELQERVPLSVALGYSPMRHALCSIAMGGGMMRAKSMHEARMRHDRVLPMRAISLQEMVFAESTFDDAIGFHPMSGGGGVGVGKRGHEMAVAGDVVKNRKPLEGFQPMKVQRAWQEEHVPGEIRGGGGGGGGGGGAVEFAQAGGFHPMRHAARGQEAHSQQYHPVSMAMQPPQPALPRAKEATRASYDTPPLPQQQQSLKPLSRHRAPPATATTLESPAWHVGKGSMTPLLARRPTTVSPSSSWQSIDPILPPRVASLQPLSRTKSDAAYDASMLTTERHRLQPMLHSRVMIETPPRTFPRRQVTHPLPALIELHGVRYKLIPTTSDEAILAGTPAGMDAYA